MTGAVPRPGNWDKCAINPDAVPVLVLVLVHSTHSRTRHCSNCFGFWIWWKFSAEIAREMGDGFMAHLDFTWLGGCYQQLDCQIFARWPNCWLRLFLNPFAMKFPWQPVAVKSTSIILAKLKSWFIVELSLITIRQSLRVYNYADGIRFYGIIPLKFSLSLKAKIYPGICGSVFHVAWLPHITQDLGNVPQTRAD